MSVFVKENHECRCHLTEKGGCHSVPQTHWDPYQLQISIRDPLCMHEQQKSSSTKLDKCNEDYKHTSSSASKYSQLLSSLLSIIKLEIYSGMMKKLKNISLGAGWLKNQDFPVFIMPGDPRNYAKARVTNTHEYSTIWLPAGHTHNVLTHDVRYQKAVTYICWWWTDLIHKTIVLPIF